MQIHLHPLRTIVKEYQWIHLVLGIMGNITFLIGSILFLSESLQHAGTWMFIVGSIGMLIGNLGSALVKYENKKRHA
jgi:hypothetical protein